MGLLDDIRKAEIDRVGACETCGNLVPIGKAALGCEAHDKLILSEYPPYHGNCKCADWIKQSIE